MARRRSRRHSTGTVSQISDAPRDVLRRRAHKLAGKGQHRKAALALRQLAALTGAAADYVQLGAMLSRARRTDEAVLAFKQGLFLHRQAGAQKRATSVARLIVAIAPHDEKARALARAA